MSAIITESRLTCPECAFEELLTMPTNACQWFHECRQCGVLLRPQPGHCCVFCSYGSVACPPIQAEKLGLVEEACCGPG